METKTCKYCKEVIDKKAKRCPKCGGKFGLPTWAKILIIFAIVILCMVGCVHGCTNSVNEAVDNTINSYKDIHGKTSFKVNETFENKYEKITMTEVNTNFTDYSEYFGPSDGNKIIMLKFEVENISEDKSDLYVSSLNFNAYANDVAVNSYIWADSTYNDLSATVGAGKKAIGYIFYEVPSSASKITVEYNADIWADGTQIEFIVQE